MSVHAVEDGTSAVASLVLPLPPKRRKTLIKFTLAFFQICVTMCSTYTHWLIILFCNAGHFGLSRTILPIAPI